MFESSETQPMLLAGAPNSAKLVLLKALAQHGGCREPEYVTAELLQNENAGIWALRASNGARTKTIFTISGAFWYPDPVPLNILFSKVSSVLYAVPAQHPKVWNPDLNQTYFDVFQKAAKASGKSWDQIPWQFVMTKADYGSEIAEEFLIPDQLRKEAISIALEAKGPHPVIPGMGVAELWQRIWSFPLV